VLLRILPDGHKSYIEINETGYSVKEGKFKRKKKNKIIKEYGL